MKKNLKIGIIALLISLLGIGSVSANEVFSVKQHKSSLIITSNLPGENNKIKVEKEGESFIYKLNNGKTEVPLQLGNGSYQVLILQHKEGNSYIIKKRLNIITKGITEKGVYLGGSEVVDWRNSFKTIEKSTELTKEIKTDKEKMKSIYSYVVKNIKYDNEKASTVKKGYTPIIDNVLDSNKGICYDYASVFAGMLRAQGIPTKLVMGYNKDIVSYHAWNEVLLGDKWVVIDTTYDAAYYEKGLEINMEKNREDYIIKYSY